MKDTLNGIKIIDFSHRLPGPFASYLLANLGADITKVEDQKFKDPFIAGSFPKIDASFKAWYEQFNKDKKITRLDFNSETIKDEIAKLISEADALILALPEKVVLKLGIKEAIKECKKPLTCIELVASTEGTKSHMHDLNALADMGILSVHIEGRSEKFIAPPLLPIAGIAFGNQIALNILAGMIKTQSDQKAVFSKVGLFESTQTMFGPFWSEEVRDQKTYLHTGRYPCYGIYRSKDGQYIALAAVEEKFWQKFCELFKLGELDAFDTNENGSKTKVIDALSNLTLSEIKSTIGNHEICLSVS